MSIEEAPIRCRFCKDIIEVDKAGERYIITAFSGGVKEYEHWKCYQAADVYKSTTKYLWWWC